MKIRNDENVLSRNRGLKKHLDTELKIIKNQVPSIQMDVKNVNETFTLFVDEYFGKFHANMNEVKGYFNSKINRDIDETKVNNFFGIMAMFEMKYHTQ